MTDKVKENGVILTRLPYICMELMNNENPESIDYNIASYILKNIKTLHGASIQDLADACNVSKSTFSRFCRKAGLVDFQQVKEELNELKNRKWNRLSFIGDVGAGKTFLQDVAERIIALDKVIDYRRIHKLAVEIAKHDNVLVMGSMQAMNPAVNLQQDLFLEGKVVRVPSTFALQQDAVLRSGKGDLLIVFSNSASFCKSIMTTDALRRKMDEMRVWMISGNEKAGELPYVDETIYVPDNHSYATHPMQFNLVARLIVRDYADRIEA